MKSIECFLVLVLLFAGVTLVSCDQQTTTMTTESPQITTTATTSGAGRYQGLGLTEDQIKMLEEQGMANIESRETASAIAGFDIAVPSFVPEGFVPGKFMINISGAGLPADMAPKFNNTKVQQVFTWSRSVMFTLIQGTHPFGIGGGEPIEIDGLQVEKTVSYESPEDGQQFERLTYGWEENGLYFALTGILAGGLDEAVMKQILLSVSAE